MEVRWPFYYKLLSISLTTALLFSSLLVYGGSESANVAQCSAELQEILSLKHPSNSNYISDSSISDIQSFMADTKDIAEKVNLLGRRFENGSFSLNSSWSLAASRIVDGILKAKYPNIKMEVMKTEGQSGLGGESHAYLKSPVPFKTGQHLIIDPTIRQFFWPRINPINYQRVPEIFVGTEIDLNNLFKSLLDPEDFRAHNRIQEYLEARDLETIVKLDPKLSGFLALNLRVWIKDNFNDLIFAQNSKTKSLSKIQPHVRPRNASDLVSLNDLQDYFKTLQVTKGQVSENLARKGVDPNGAGFIVDRGVVETLSKLPPELSYSISTLGTNDQILVLGSGNLVFEREFFDVQNGKLGNVNLESLTDPNKFTPNAIKAIKKVSEIPPEDRPGISSVTYEASPKATANLFSKINPIIGDFFSNVDISRILGGKRKPKIVLDFMGVLAYTDNFVGDLSKALDVMADDGTLYFFGGPGGTDILKNTVTLINGQKISLVDYIKANPTIDVELITHYLGAAKLGTLRIRKVPGVKPRFGKDLLLVKSDSGTPPIREFLEYAPSGKPYFDPTQLEKTLQQPRFVRDALGILSADPWIKEIMNRNRVFDLVRQGRFYADQFGIETNNPNLNLALILKELGWSLSGPSKGVNFPWAGKLGSEAARVILKRSGMNDGSILQVTTLIEDGTLNRLVDGLSKVEETYKKIIANADQADIPREKYFRIIQWLFISESHANNPNSKLNVMFQDGKARISKKIMSELSAYFSGYDAETLNSPSLRITEGLAISASAIGIKRWSELRKKILELRNHSSVNPGLTGEEVLLPEDLSQEELRLVLQLMKMSENNGNFIETGAWRITTKSGQIKEVTLTSDDEKTIFETDAIPKLVNLIETNKIEYNDIKNVQFFHIHPPEAGGLSMNDYKSLLFYKKFLQNRGANAALHIYSSSIEEGRNLTTFHMSLIKPLH